MNYTNIAIDVASKGVEPCLRDLGCGGYYLMHEWGTAAAAVTTAKTLAMTTPQKILVAATVASAIGVSIYQARQASLLRAQVNTLQQELAPPSEPAKQTAFALLQKKVEGLETQNVELSQALSQANADKARLQAEREQARRSTALYKELAEQANSQNMDATNEYPTQRHVWAAFGRLGRLGALSKEDDSNLSPEEKSALEAARTKALEDLPNLVKAAKQYDSAKPSATDVHPEDLVDQISCVLYGALNLDEQQFSQVYGVMQNLAQEAKQNGLSKDTAAPEATVAIKQIMQQFKAETQALLTPEQIKIFAEVVTHFQAEPGKFGYNFNF
jgi:hypothetical protein